MNSINVNLRTGAVVLTCTYGGSFVDLIVVVSIVNALHDHVQRII